MGVKLCLTFLADEYRVRVFDNRTLRGMFRPKESNRRLEKTA
jgi:hypothetical protein